jgi:lipopolysaccharide export system protein LptC
MNQGRKLLDRLTAWSPILLLGSLAALTFWLDAQVAPQPPRRDGSSRHDPDLYVESFRAMSFAPDGRVSQSLSAKRAQHFPDDESTVFTEPAIVLTEPGRPRFSVNAAKADLAGDRETIAFSGNVRAVRDALPPAAKTSAPNSLEGPSGPVTIATEYLRVLPRQGRADTPQPVTIEEARGIIHAVGMELDNQAKTLKLKSGVRGSLQPSPPAKR